MCMGDENFDYFLSSGIYRYERARSIPNETGSAMRFVVNYQ